MPMRLFMDEGGLQNAKSIVFFHDLGSSNQIWRYHMATLRHDFHCLLVDLPGHGNSRDIEWTNFDDVVEIVADAIKDRARGKPHLVGFALGGYLILKFLEKHADLVDKVIVDGAGHRPITGNRKGIAMTHLLPLLKNTRIVAQLLTMIMRENGVPEPDCRILIEDLQRARRKSVQRAMSQAATLKVDAVFDNPALFVSGEYEAAAIHDSHRTLAQKNPWSECVYYPNRGHAWLFGDIASHIQLVRYFLLGDDFPEKLRRL